MVTGIAVENMYSFYRQNQEAYHEDYARLRQLLESNDVKYGNYTLSCEVMPTIITRTEYDEIIRASELVITAAEKFTDMVVASTIWQEQFSWEQDFMKLVLADPGYSYNIPCARFDSFLRDGILTFVELNTDGCSGMTNVDIFGTAYRQVLSHRGFNILETSVWDSVVPRVFSTLLNCYAEFRERYSEAKLPEEPTIGILDWKDESTHWEFTAFASYCRKQGINAHLISPDTLRYSAGTLYHNDIPIHLLYRRMLGIDYAENMQKLEPVSHAFMDRKVCMVGSPRSQIAFSKKLFAYLLEPAVLAELPVECAEAVCRYVPWTRELKGMTTEFKNEKIELLPFIIRNKEAFVIKPCVSKCGAGIYQGRYTEKEEWEAAVTRGISMDYIVQEFIELPTAEFPRFTVKKATETRYVHIGEYVFGGKFSGFLGRTCGHPLMNLRHGERLLGIMHHQA